MNNSILATPRFLPMESTMNMHPGSQPQSSSHAPPTQQVGLFDQFLTQAEKEFLANQLQQMKWHR